MSGRSRCRPAGAVARQLGGIPYPEGGGRVEGDALSQIVGMVEPPVADPGALFQGMAEPLDAPAKLAPAQQRLGALKVGLALGAEQHPVERLFFVRRRLFLGRHREPGAALLARALAAAGGNPDPLRAQRRGGLDVLPKIDLAVSGERLAARRFRKARRCSRSSSRTPAGSPRARPACPGARGAGVRGRRPALVHPAPSDHVGRRHWRRT